MNTTSKHCPCVADHATMDKMQRVHCAVTQHVRTCAQQPALYVHPTKNILEDPGGTHDPQKTQTHVGMLSNGAIGLRRT